MAQFLTTNGTSYHIENIIKGAKNKLVLISPFLQISKTFYERLKDATNRNVQILIIYGKDNLKPNEKNSLAELNNVELRFFENLHAKCYFNEREMVITSMNMYEFSEKNNREMGVFLTKNEDSKLYEDGVAEADSILVSSEKVALSKTIRSFTTSDNSFISPKRNETKTDKKEPTRGYCIRCQSRIQYNKEKPYCFACYTTWAQFENPEYEENVCHSCGEYENSTMNKPLCYECFKAYSN